MSTISAVSSASSAQQSSSTQGSRRTDPFKALEEAISSGDIDTAKQIYAQLKEHAPKKSDSTSSTSSSTSSTSSAEDTMSQDFEALGEALDSGDVDSIKAAFSTFKTDAASAMKAHKMHGPPPPSDGTSDVTLQLPTDTVGNNVNTAV